MNFRAVSEADFEAEAVENVDLSFNAVVALLVR